MINALLLAAAMTNFFNVDVIKVTDGDTIKVDIPRMPAVFSPIGVRIKGIDTAELHDKRACIRIQSQVAKAAVENLVHKTRVDLYNCEADKYMRLLCDVVVEDRIDVATYMLENNFARGYWGEKKKAFTCPR